MKFERICPLCFNKINYSGKYTFITANKKNTPCRKCVSVKTGFTKRYATKGSNIGSLNGFYNKKHSKESIEKFVKNRGSCKSYKTKEFRQRMSSVTSGKNNGMFGKRVFDIWVEKYGLEKATELQKTQKQKLSKANSGSNNPMYGKPTPKKAGNGWSGWYKNWFFRSLRELSYMINVIEKKKLIWKSGECKKLTIKYRDYLGNDKTYRADFLVNDTLIEIKPKKLHSTVNNKLKKEAALLFCKQHNLKYKMIDCKTISLKKIKKTFKNRRIKACAKNYGEIN